MFASSRDGLRRSLNGVAVEVQGTDYSEVAYEAGESALLFISFTPQRAATTIAVLKLRVDGG